jgi:D-glycero-D-manno-heptose 1,7-bisphosphate phosphatase
LFLDRDGVVLTEVDHLWRVADARFVPGAVAALRAVPRDVPIVLITNQAGIARGLYGVADYHRLNRWLTTTLRRRGVRIARTYFCPHHPAGAVRRFRRTCSCRKPGTLLFRRAARALRADLTRSWSIGDKTSDVLAGKRAGTTTVLVRTGYGGRDGLFRVRADHTVRNLAAAVARMNRGQ